MKQKVFPGVLQTESILQYTAQVIVVLGEQAMMIVDCLFLRRANMRQAKAALAFAWVRITRDHMLFLNQTDRHCEFAP